MENQAKNLCWLSFIFLLTWTSCTYTPEEEFLNQLSGPDLSNISLNGAADTIFLTEKQSFAYTFTAPGKNVYSYRVYLGDDYISAEYENGKIIFELEPADYPDGIHELKIGINLSGGTGSLADRLETEVIHFQEQFFVRIFLSPPSSIRAPEVAIVDGRLIMEWKPADKTNLYGYKVLKSFKDRDNIQRTDTLYTGGPDSTSVQDEFYAGGAVTYRVDIYGYKYYVPGEEKTFEADPIEISVNLTDEQTVKISWTNFLLYNNKLIFRLYKTDLFNNSVSFLKEGSFELNQTLSPQKEGEIVVDFEEEFGNPELYKWIITPDHEDWYNSNRWTEIHEAAKGKKIHPFEAIAFDQVAKKMYLIYFPEEDQPASRLIRYNLLSMQAEDSTDLQLSGLQKILISENGQYLYIEEKVDDDIQLRRINPLTMDVQETISLSDLVSPLDYNAKVTSVSNNNLLALSNGSYYALLDLNRKTTSWRSTLNVQIGNDILISPEGDYIYHTHFEFVYNNSYTNDPVYDLFYYIHYRRDNTWESIGRIKVSGGGKVYGFKNQMEKGFIHQNGSGGRIRFQQVSDGVLGDPEFYFLPDEYIRIKNYDSFRDDFYVSFTENNTSYLGRYDYRTQEKSGKLKFHGHYQYGNYENIYFASSGYYYVVQE